MARAMALSSIVRPRRSETPSEMGYEHPEDDPYTEYESGDDPYYEPKAAQRAALTKKNRPSEEDEDEGDAEDDGDSGSADGEDQEEVQQQISRTSFAALKQAQDAMSKKRKRGSESNHDQEEKLAALRSRLKDLRAKSDIARKGKDGSQSLEQDRTNGHVQDADSEDDQDSDSAPSEEGAPSKSRTSKHAPASQSTRHQVTRKRNVIDVPKRTYRDPRFDAMHDQPRNLKDHNEKAYAFLTDYQKSEIKDLRTAIKATRNEDEKETLRRKMVSMENRLKSKAAKEREQEVVRKHRREERERVEQGKQPFYLKRKEVKQKALEEKFKGMKGKEREKLMERRRKKEGQKEKKRMPMARRVER